MSDDDWDTPNIKPIKSWDDEEPKPVAAKMRSWDDEEEVIEKSPEPVAAAPKDTGDKKKNWAEKAEERKEEEKKKKEAEEKKKAEEEKAKKLAEQELKSLSAQEKKKREKEAVEKSDFDNAKELFGVEVVEPVTSQDFTSISENVTTKLRKYEKNKEYYGMVEKICKGLAQGLKADDIRKISSHLNTLYLEKQKEEKAKQQPVGKKSKAKVKISDKLNDDGEDFDDDEPLPVKDDYDFM